MKIPKVLLHPPQKMDFVGSFGALLVGCLVVVARGLYLARHLFTLFYLSLYMNIFISLYFVFWVYCIAAVAIIPL